MSRLTLWLIVGAAASAALVVIVVIVLAIVLAQDEGGEPAATVVPTASATVAGPSTSPPATQSPGASPSASSLTPVAAGQIIFDRGTDPATGKPIPRRAGKGRHLMGMMLAGCATCHGVDGHGLKTMMFSAPNITYANLTNPKGMLAPDGTRGPTYTAKSLHKTVTSGVDPDGSDLEYPMPIWQLTSTEWTDLLAYLKTLH